MKAYNDHGISISIHAPPRGATAPGTAPPEKRTPISIHAPPRGATAEWQYVLPVWNFNSRPSARGDRVLLPSPFPSSYFNSRPSARGDQAQHIMVVNFDLFQFTPLREGRRGKRTERGRRQNISIHAPPRGATVLDEAKRQGFPISIHAPPRGATRGKKPDWACDANFNSRPSARGDQTKRCIHELRQISIHAPPRGATQGVC